MLDFPPNFYLSSDKNAKSISPFKAFYSSNTAPLHFKDSLFFKKRSNANKLFLYQYNKFEPFFENIFISIKNNDFLQVLKNLHIVYNHLKFINEGSVFRQFFYNFHALKNDNYFYHILNLVGVQNNLTNEDLNLANSKDINCKQSSSIKNLKKDDSYSPLFGLLSIFLYFYILKIKKYPFLKLIFQNLKKQHIKIRHNQKCKLQKNNMQKYVIKKCKVKKNSMPNNKGQKFYNAKKIQKIMKVHFIAINVDMPFLEIDDVKRLNDFDSAFLCAEKSHFLLSKWSNNAMPFILNAIKNNDLRIANIINLANFRKINCNSESKFLNINTKSDYNIAIDMILNRRVMK